MKNWIQELENIMETLRQENGCPWDREQDYQSLKKYLIEECGEFLDAVDQNNFDEMCEELGDILMNLCFYAQLAKEDKKFNLQRAAQLSCEKMIRRHPHVFGNSNAKTTKEIEKQWDEIKKSEKNQKRTLLEEIPRNIPALLRAEKVQLKVKKEGFDWKNWEGAFSKLKEEINELEEAFKTGDISKIEDELGDVLFSAVNIARHKSLPSENVLHNATNKFIKRFEKVNQLASKNLREMSEDELTSLWNQSKKGNN